MDDIFEQVTEPCEVIPEFNSAGRLCNFHAAGQGETVTVPAEEWERFNELAGRQHEIVDGAVVFNAGLEPCVPDGTEAAVSSEQRLQTLEAALLEMAGELYG